MPEGDEKMSDQTWTIDDFERAVRKAMARSESDDKHLKRYLDSQTARQNLVYFVMRRRLGGELIETWKTVAHKVST